MELAKSHHFVRNGAASFWRYARRDKAFGFCFFFIGGQEALEYPLLYEQC